MEIKGHHSEVEFSTDRIIGEDHSMPIIIEMTSGETVSENHKIIEVKLLEMDKEVLIEMNTLEEVEVGLGKDKIWVILAEMTEVVVVGPEQVQEPVLTETELDVLSVGNMTIFLKTVQIHKQKKSQNKYKKCII